MYYLLEDNRIVIYKEKYFDIFYYENRKGFLYKVFYDKEYGEDRKIGKIKKQSENVLDLIDWDEDLVNINTSCGSLIVDCKHVKSDFNDGFYDLEWIKAIYKPDSSGNYIKVWEAKDE